MDLGLAKEDDVGAFCDSALRPEAPSESLCRYWLGGSVPNLEEIPHQVPVVTRASNIQRREVYLQLPGDSSQR